MSKDQLQHLCAITVIAATVLFVGYASWKEGADARAWREKFKADNHCNLIYTGSRGSRYQCDHGVIFETMEKQP